jgi:hypothetical protein
MGRGGGGVIYKENNSILFHETAAITVNQRSSCPFDFRSPGRRTGLGGLENGNEIQREREKWRETKTRIARTGER